MSSESVQKRIELLLKEVAEAVAESDWAVVINRAQNVLRMESENKDALAYMDAAEQAHSLFPYDTAP